MDTEKERALSALRTLSIAWVRDCILVLAYLSLGYYCARKIRTSSARGRRRVLGTGLVIGSPWESITPAQWRSYLLPVGLFGIAGTAAVLYAVHQVRCMLRETDVSPFTATNANRIRKAGLAVLCSAAAKALRDVAFGSFVTSNVAFPGAKIGHVTNLGLSTASSSA